LAFGAYLLLIGCGGNTSGTGGATGSVVVTTSAARADAVCTGDTECAAGSICIDTHCLDEKAWAAGVLAERRKRIGAARTKATTAGVVLRDMRDLSTDAAARALAADGAAAWTPGHAWRVAAHPNFKNARFELVGDVDVTGGRAVPVPLPDSPLDLSALLADLDRLEKHYADLAATPAQLKVKVDELDGTLRMHETSAEGVSHPPVLVRGFFRDTTLTAAPAYPGCPAGHPLRRVYAGYFFVPATRETPLRVTVEADTPDVLSFVPDARCTDLVRSSAQPKVLSLFVPHLRDLARGVGPVEEPDAYVRTVW
jgi:hypothetical protein